jgi:hypothetical protein
MHSSAKSGSDLAQAADQAIGRALAAGDHCGLHW